MRGFESHLSHFVRYGVVGNISACHADARGSIPRVGGLISLFAHDRDRTCDRWLIRPMLYQLSYTSHRACRPISSDVRPVKLSAGREIRTLDPLLTKQMQ